MEEQFNPKNPRVYAKAVRAGKRTYFFDVKETRGGDYYLNITESKKKFKEDGTGDHYFMKSKIFLYKEDFDKFQSGLNDVIDYIRKEKGTEPNHSTAVNRDPGAVSQDADSYQHGQSSIEKPASDQFTDVNFDDLDTK